MRWLCLVILVGCWTRPPEPPHWKSARAPELLPDGEWLVVALDLDVDSPGQRKKEAEARNHPASIRTAPDSCSIPATHVAFAVYGKDDLAVAMRGGFQREGLLDCIAAIAKNGGSVIGKRELSGYEVMSLAKDHSEFLVSASRHGVVVATDSAPMMTRILDGTPRSATSDLRLAPLIAEARAGGPLWAAGLLPAKVRVIDDLVGMLGTKLGGRIVSVVGSVRFAPAQITVTLGLEREQDAVMLASAIEGKRKQLRSLADPALVPIVDALAVKADGARLQIVGTPPKVDWWQALQAMLRLYAQLHSA